MSDREKVINDLQEQIEELEERLAIVLEGQPEIVRCKDCKHGDDTIINGKYLFKTCGGINHEPDWFCADGEAK